MYDLTYWPRYNMNWLRISGWNCRSNVCTPTINGIPSIWSCTRWLIRLPEHESYTFQILLNEYCLNNELQILPYYHLQLQITSCTLLNIVLSCHSWLAQSSSWSHFTTFYKIIIPELINKSEWFVGLTVGESLWKI